MGEQDLRDKCPLTMEWTRAVGTTHPPGPAENTPCASFDEFLVCHTSCTVISARVRGEIQAQIITPYQLAATAVVPALSTWPGTARFCQETPGRRGTSRSRPSLH